MEKQKVSKEEDAFILYKMVNNTEDDIIECIKTIKYYSGFGTPHIRIWEQRMVKECRNVEFCKDPSMMYLERYVIVENIPFESYKTINIVDNEIMYFNENALVWVLMVL